MVVGRADTVTHLAAPRQPLSWPRRVGVVPRQADCFQHREAVGALDGALAGGGTPVPCQILSGTGGVGKTQLAARHARTAWEAGEVDLLVWVTATSRDAILSAYAEAAVTVTGPDEAVTADLDDPEKAAARFLAWTQCTGRRWLIVLDDLSDPADLGALDGRRDLWPAPSANGRTLVTTRRRDAALPGHPIDVGLFTPDEADAYLTAKLSAARRQDSREQMAALARDLGHLPLALAQAATYLIDLHLDCAAYRARLADRAHALPDLVPEDSGLPDAHRATVAATWSLSIEHADRLRPRGLARPMLRLSSLLNPNGIPAVVLTSPAVLAYLTEHRTPDDREAAGASSRRVGVEDAADALRCLHRLSLADHSPDTPHHAVRVHNLIQRTTRETLPAAAPGALAVTCADALLEVWPETDLDTALAQALRANTAALAAHASAELWRAGLHPVLIRAGGSLGDAGLTAGALAYFRDLAAAACRHLGADHPDTLTARHHLAHWQGDTGDIAGARGAMAHLLADRLRILGPDHPDTLATRGDLGALQGLAGDPGGAGAASEAVLRDTARVLGPDHLQTLTARQNLAHWTGEAGNPAGAVAACEHLLADTVRLLGPDHRKTLAARLHLALWRGEAGDAAGAATAFEDLLADQLRILGADHPHTLATRHDLARWRGKAGDPAGAATASEDLLADQLRVLGPDHPHTLATRHDLARWRGKAGDPAGAASAFEDLLADQLRVLGPDHPDTLTTRHDLASWRGEAGDSAGAAAALGQLLADRVRVLGPDHPHTFITRGNLAHWTGKAGDPAGAARAFEALLTDRLRVLGPHHPRTLITRQSLAQWRGEAGDPAGAATALGRLLVDQVRVLGPDHPDTLTTRGSLARWRSRTDPSPDLR
ncbi:tetratricopeptide repeat protein [Streptomyces sp. NPDC048270]|uniref:tetratricopeptide repeat protein n=1 Tax=Streptomyces sp. NPDC048270 TaxID=3154615 RepID=UPI0033E9182C